MNIFTASSDTTVRQMTEVSQQNKMTEISQRKKSVWCSSFLHIFQCMRTAPPDQGLGAATDKISLERKSTICKVPING